jgi:hypothetical protein
MPDHRPVAFDTEEWPDDRGFDLIVQSDHNKDMDTDRLLITEEGL